jgi:tRNA A-37 threonylcarbamoyl transferase component Bud32
MRHLHREGVIHGDVYSRNVLLFTEEECPGGLMAKWTDFGRSISRKHWSGADVSVQDLTTLLRRDTHEFGSMLASLLAKADASHDNEGHDLQTLKEMANTLKTTPKTLDEVLTDYHFGEEEEDEE